MLALNPECIEYYKPIDIDIYNHKIINIYNKEYIKEPSKEYYNLVNYIRDLFPDIKSNNYKDYILQLIEIKKHLLKTLDNKINNIDYLKDNIDKSRIIETIIRNIYREKYREKEKILRLTN